MAFLALWCFLMLAAAVPGLWPRALGIAAYPPDPWVILVVYFAMRGRGFAAVGWGIALGFVKDALSLDPLGTHAFVLGTMAFFFCEGRRHRTPVDGAMRVAAVFGASLVAGWLYVLRVLPMGGGAASWSDVFAAVPTALWTTLVAAGLYPLLDHYKVFDDLMGRHRGLPA